MRRVDYRTLGLALAAALTATSPPSVSGQAPAAPSPAPTAASVTEERMATQPLPRGNYQLPPCPDDLEGWNSQAERFAVAGKRGAWFLLLDGQETGPYEEVSLPLVFSPAGDRLAYYAKRGKRWFAVIDGKEEPSFPGKFLPSVLAHKIAFSPDGRRVAYAAFTNNTNGHLVVDGQSWPECQLVYGGPILFSRDSQHVAVACQLPGVLISQTAVFLDGKEHVRFNQVASYAFRPGTAELVVLGIGRGGRGASDDIAVLGLGPTSGIEPGRRYTRVINPPNPPSPYIGGPHFSADGAHVAYSVSDNQQVDLYVDGRSVYYRKGTPWVHSMTLSSDGTRLLAMLLERSLLERSRNWIVDLRLGADATGRWSVLETKEEEALSASEVFLSPSGRHSAYLATHQALRAADNWWAAVLDGRPGPHYADICLGLFPRWSAEEALLYVAGRADGWYRVTQRLQATAP